MPYTLLNNFIDLNSIGFVMENKNKVNLIFLDCERSDLVLQ